MKAKVDVQVCWWFIWWEEQRKPVSMKYVAESNT